VTTSAAQPGVYMGNTTFSGTIAPGLYIFKVAPGESSAIVNLTGKVAGNGVTFYFADENVTLAANVSEASTLTAPTSGPYTGILIFMPDNFTRHQTITIQSLDKAILTGLIYTPNWDIDIHSWSESTTNGTWVANTMREDSQSHWTLNPGPLSIGIYADGTSGIAYAPTTGAAPKISLKN
jgi:hypothetical protein